MRVEALDCIVRDIVKKFIPNITKKLDQFENLIKQTSAGKNLDIIRIGYTRRTYQEYLQVRRMMQEGVSLNKISQMLSRPYSTIRNYANISQSEIELLKSEYHRLNQLKDEEEEK
jgi:DNA-binding NarL/FixJ family response regulator